MNTGNFSSFVLLLSITAAPVWAASVGVVDSFVANTPASATQINDKFREYGNAVNDNDTRLNNSEIAISDNLTEIANIASALDSSVTISAAGFRPGDHTQPFEFNVLLNNGQLVIPADVPTNDGIFYAPLPLPAGVRIILLEALIFDSTQTGRVEIALRRGTESTGPTDIIRFGTTGPEFPGITTRSDSLDETVAAGPSIYYFLEASLIGDSSSARAVGLMSVTIHYEYP